MILLADYLRDIRSHLAKLPFAPKFVPETLKIVDADNSNTLFFMSSPENLCRVDSLPTIVNSFVDINMNMVSDVSRPDDNTVLIEVTPNDIIVTADILSNRMADLIAPTESWNDVTIAVRKYQGGELYGVNSIQRVERSGEPCIIITASDYTLKLLEEK